VLRVHVERDGNGRGRGKIGDRGQENRKYRAVVQVARWVIIFAFGVGLGHPKGCGHDKRVGVLDQIGRWMGGRRRRKGKGMIREGEESFCGEKSMVIYSGKAISN
jgi:Myelin basic protein